jgi:hypothetical protein
LSSISKSVVTHDERYFDAADFRINLEEGRLLAGALGARLWVGVPFVPDWRWGRDGRHSAWCPTATVNRQPQPGDWASVFREMARDLTKLTGSEAG